MQNPYNVFYNNYTGRVVFQNNSRNLSPNKCRSQSPQQNLNSFLNKKMEELRKNRSQSPTNDFYKKMEELSKISGLNINTSKNNSISSSLPKPIYNETEISEINNTRNMFSSETYINDKHNIELQYKDFDSLVNKKNDNNEEISNEEIANEIKKLNTNRIEFNKKIEIENLNHLNNVTLIKKDLTYGIKKTILSDFNYLYASSNCNDFKVGINKNNNQLNTIFDVFYLFPNISEINTKNETNIINEKKVEIFPNRFLNDDKQYFPIDYIPCGITIPLRTNIDQFTKLKIKNIFWNIFQSIDSDNYKTNELLAVVPDKNEFAYVPVAFQINFELHSQLSDKFLKNNTNPILPYRNSIKSINPANSCLFTVYKFTIENLNGSNFSDIDIDIPANLNLDCAMLCIKISIPDGFISILKGIDKYNKVFYGFIPFSQFVLNFDYELSL